MIDAKDIHNALAEWLEGEGYSRMCRLEPLAGGDINQTCLLATDDGATFCIKQNPSAPRDFFWV